MKKQIKHSFRFFSAHTCFLLAFFCLAGQASAQAPAPITAEVDRREIPLHETLTLTVTVTTDSLSAPSPEIPPLDGFDVLGTRTSSSFSLVNGRMTASSSMMMTLRAMRAGELTIEPFSISLDGKTYESEPIQVRVLDAGTPAAVDESAAPPQETAGKDFFVEAEVDNPEPYVSQALIYTFRFYQITEVFGQPYFSAPDFAGFWSERETSQTRRTALVGGVSYDVSELRTLLFPTAAGDVTIAPARLTLPGGFFDPDTELKTDAVLVKVKPLPGGAPAGFNGAVGQYTLDASLSAAQGKVNEPLTLKVILSGKGNLKNLPDPVWPHAPGWRTFDSKAATDARLEGGEIQGRRTYERLLVPEKEGPAVIPAVRYAYFDPKAEAYREIQSPVFNVEILPGAPETPLPSASQSAQAEVAQQAADIRFLKPVPLTLSVHRPALASLWFYWLAWALPALFLGLDFYWTRRQERLNENSAGVRSSRALRRAKKAMKDARRSGTDAYNAGEGILLTYLEDKLGLPVRGLTHAGRAELIVSRGVSEDGVARVRAFLEICEAGRFSPLGRDDGQTQNLLQELAAQLDDLEKELER